MKMKKLPLLISTLAFLTFGSPAMVKEHFSISVKGIEYNLPIPNGKELIQVDINSDYKENFQNQERVSREYTRNRIKMLFADGTSLEGYDGSRTSKPDGKIDSWENLDGKTSKVIIERDINTDGKVDSILTIKTIPNGTTIEEHDNDADGKIESRGVYNEFS